MMEIRLPDITFENSILQLIQNLIKLTKLLMKLAVDGMFNIEGFENDTKLFEKFNLSHCIYILIICLNFDI